MNWNLEGLCVIGKYLGEIPITGKVRLSRVKYGGGISHHVELIFPREIYGTMRETVIIDHENVERIFSNY